MTRHAIREQTFKALYLYAFYSEEDEPSRRSQMLLFVNEDPDFSGTEQEREEIRETVQEIADEMIEIDSKIEAASTYWKISRMNKMDLSILRLATFELLYRDLEIGVVANEAVELAKAYGTDDSGRFVNGVLGRIAENR